MTPTSLTESRIQLHYAIQCMAAVNAALASPQPDASHTALTWRADLKSFAGQPLAASKPAISPVQVALEPISLTACLLDRQGQPLVTLALAGKTMDEALLWHKTVLNAVGIDATEVELLHYPPDEFPDHPLAHGATFEPGNAETRQAIATYYAESHTLLQAIALEAETDSPVHIWPHHFDMALSIPLAQENGNGNGADANSEDAPSIGVGFSPGGGGYVEPYWYVTRWPYPYLDTYPTLEEPGHWHTDDWVGAVLNASDLDCSDLEFPDVMGAASRIRAFLDSAIAILRRL